MFSTGETLKRERPKPASNKALRNEGDWKNLEIPTHIISWIALEIKRKLAQQMNAKKWCCIRFSRSNLGGFKVIGMLSKWAEEGKVKSKKKTSEELLPKTGRGSCHQKCQNIPC